MWHQICSHMIKKSTVSSQRTWTWTVVQRGHAQCGKSHTAGQAHSSSLISMYDVSWLFKKFHQTSLTFQNVCSMPGTVTPIPLSLHLFNYKVQAVEYPGGIIHKTERQFLVPAPKPYSLNWLDSHAIKYLGITFISQYKYRVARAGDGDWGRKGRLQPAQNVAAFSLHQPPHLWKKKWGWVGRPLLWWEKCLFL